MSSYPWIHRDRVRFRDCDAMGHVNNAVYSTYLEEARIGVLGDLFDFILARVEIDFRSELRMGEDVEVRTRCPRIGTKSFDLEHAVATSGRPRRRRSQERPRLVRLRAGRERGRAGRAPRAPAALTYGVVPGALRATFTVTSRGPRLSISSRSTSSPGLRLASSFARSAAELISVVGDRDHVADGEIRLLSRPARIDNRDGSAPRGRVEPELDCR